MLFQRLKADAAADWTAYTDHTFVRLLGDGTLPEPAFRVYLEQDYLFLIQFARAHALAIYKARSLAQMHEGLATLRAILEVEMDLHVRLSDGWGVTVADLEGARELSPTVAYTRFVLDAGMSGDLLDLFVALAPCMIGYRDIAVALAPGSPPDNPYQAWIDEYASSGYDEVARMSEARLDALAPASIDERRYAELLSLFAAASRLEADFWQMGLDATQGPTA